MDDQKQKKVPEGEEDGGMSFGGCLALVLGLVGLLGGLVGLLGVLGKFAKLLKLAPLLSKIAPFLSKLGLGLKTLAIGVPGKLLGIFEVLGKSPLKMADEIVRIVGNWISEIHSLSLLARGASHVNNATCIEKTADQMTLAITQSFSGYYTAIAVVAMGCLFLICLSFLPILKRLLFSRKPSVFISFSHTRESVAEVVEGALRRSGFLPTRFPYDTGIAHQDVVLMTQQAIRKCAAVVCLPGDQESYVGSEVAAATSLKRPIVFGLFRDSGLPNTADKRYPVFRLEPLTENNFQPLNQFLHYVLADFRSSWKLIGESIKRPFLKVWTLRTLLTAVGALVLLAIVCFIKALLVSRNFGDRCQAVFEDMRFELVISSAFVNFALLAIVIPVLIFLALYAYQFWRQWLAQRRMKLKMKAASFTREDWIGVVPGLNPGDLIFECLYESAPLAHHERS